MRYAGKIVLITGSRRGVGRLLKEHFLKQGASVIGFNRNADAELACPEYTPLCVAIDNPESVAAGFAQIREKFGHIDIAINNAAVLASQHAMILPVGSVKNMLNTNILGTFLVSREAAKLMRKKKWGRIINIGSMATSLEPIGDSIYAATKAAVSTLANVMAKELASLNVTCNTLAITAIATDMLDQLPKGKIDAVIAGLPLPRYAVADDIFNVIDFFASERSAYVTAQTIYLGGAN
jgi:3-oxoacyl-[acyl-carrier protein] reductase